jgi:hypothetical protein
MTSEKSTKATSTNDLLSSDQIDLLATADIGTEISIDVKYRERNAITHQMDISTLKYALTVMPASEAEYIGGIESLTLYLKDNAIIKIQELNNQQFNQAMIKFTIDEKGDVSDIEMPSNGNEEVIQLLSDVLNNMPLWKAAQDSSGRKVKQVFILRIGNTFGC